MDIRESPSASGQKTIKFRLRLVIENNNQFVRGKKKVQENITSFCLEEYQAEKVKNKDHEYILTIEYETDDELDEIIADLYSEMNFLADSRHCFIDAEISTLDGKRKW